MRRNWKTTSLAVVGAILLFGGLWASPAVAEDRFETVYTRPNDDPNVKVAYGVRDNATDIIWGKEIVAGVIHFDPQNVPRWQEAENANLAEEGGISLADGHNDWRMPTVTEVDALFDPTLHTSGQSLTDVRDVFDLSHEDGFQGVDVEVEDESHTWGDVYFFTACVHRSGQAIYRYAFRFTDGYYFLQYGGGSILPIRNAVENHDSCPHKTKGSDGNPNKGKGKNK